MSLEQIQDYPSNRAKPDSLQWHWMKVLRLIAFKGLTPEQACDHERLSVGRFRQALERPRLKQELTRLIEDFRSGQTAKNIHTLCRIRDESSNDLARIKAIQELNRSILDHTHSRQTMPGLVIQVLDQEYDKSRSIDHVVQEDPEPGRTRQDKAGGKNRAES